MPISQEDRLLKITTPLGEDFLLLRSLTASEGLSSLFQVQLELMHEETSEGPPTGIEMQRILGKPVAISILQQDGTKRFLQGIISQFSQGNRDERFTYYRAEVVPQVWLLTHRAQSRIFQHLSVPDILKKVFAGFDVGFEIQGTFHPRDYCVQYRETDFNFASRLMEEEGIYYFFAHTAQGHKMIVANTPQSHRDCPEKSQVPFAEKATSEEGFVSAVRSWEVSQQLQSGKYTLWDHCFELPHKHLEANNSSRFAVGGNDKLEIYDYPGGYAQRFDGVDKGGGDQPGELQNIFKDNKRTVDIRMQEIDATYKVISAASDCAPLIAGYRFDLINHPGRSNNGQYVLTSVQHSAVQNPDYVSAEPIQRDYTNTFTCIPDGAGHAPFRPRRVSLKPMVPGSQTAVVVGPPGEEIFTDKYGRVKVQFHWDREGKNDADSSCWVRVAQPWAGKRWGAFFWPRIGQEVVVDFLEGDPDQPIIVGSVYNADQMPPYLGKGPDSKHPNDNKVSGVKTNSTTGGEGFNELRFDDTKSKEQIFIHAERNMDTRVKNDSMERVVGNRHLIVGWEKDGQMGGDQLEQVYQDKHLNVKRHHIEHIEGNMQLLVKGKDGGNQDISIEKKKSETIGGDNDFHVKSNRKEKIDGTTSLTVGGDQQEQVGQKHALEAGQEIHLKAGMKVILEAGVQLTIKGPGGFVDINPSGVTIQGVMVLINSGGSAGSGSGSKPAAPEDAKEASPTEPTPADDAKTGQKSAPS